MRHLNSSLLGNDDDDDADDADVAKDDADDDDDVDDVVDDNDDEFVARCVGQCCRARGNNNTRAKWAPGKTDSEQTQLKTGNGQRITNNTNTNNIRNWKDVNPYVVVVVVAAVLFGKSLHQATVYDPNSNWAYLQTKPKPNTQTVEGERRRSSWTRRRMMKEKTE